MDECPKCNSTNLKYFGKDIDIYIDKENLTDAIQLTYDSGSVKNCFKLVAGDDIITATVRILNPNGTDFIYMPTDSQLAEMHDELREKIVSYNELYHSLKDDYEGIVTELYESMNKIDYYTHTMMPTIEHAEITAQTEADKLTEMNLNPLGLSSVTTSTSKATVESALKNYARVYIKSGYVKVDINSSEYNYVGVDSDGWNYGTWTGNFKVTSYSDKEDIAYSETITIKITGDYQTFIEQKVMKNITINSNEEDSVFDVLNIDELSDFKSALELYSLNRLKSFYDAVQSALDVLIEVDQASEGADLYESFYLPYYDKLLACQSEMDIRQATIDEWQNTYDNIVLRQQEMQADMNFRDYLGEDLYNIFCLYRREDTFQNDNYISDGLTDSEIIAKSKEFLEVAEKELEKARTPKITITTTLFNLMQIPEFKPLLKDFRLGNWLRIRVDGVLYRLMLIGYDLSSSSLETMSVEFANVTKINTPSDITGEILNKAQNMSTTYNYITNQASKGNNASETVNKFVQEGLDSALVSIKSSNNNRVTTDKHGITASKYDDVMQQEDPEKARLTWNNLVFTTNNWKSVETALGRHKYYKFDEKGNLVQDTAYGLTSQFVTSGYIYGSQIISGDIYSENYKVDETGKVIQGSHLALKDGFFNFGAGSLVYDVVNGLFVKGNITSGSTITGSTIVGGSLLIGNKSNTYAEITESGILNCTGANITGAVTATSGKIGDCSISNGKLSVPAANITGQLTASQINTQGLIAENISSTTITGKTISGGSINIGNGSFTVSTAGALYCSSANVTGTITSSNLTATGGNIAGWTISGSRLYKENTSLGLYVALCAPTQVGTSGNGNADVLVCRTGINGNYNYPLVLSSDGTVTATKVNITGTINAGSGSSLGSWNVDSNSIYTGSWTSSTNRVFMCTGTSGSYTIGGSTQTGWVFGAGSTFGVTKSGGLYATSGTIGGWTINNSSLSGTNTNNGSTVILTPEGLTTSNFGMTMTWDTILTKLSRI